MLGYDSGAFNPYGNFPIFQCASMDSFPSCKNSGWSDGPFMHVGQYCQFEVRQQSETQSCLSFKGYHVGELKTEFDTCGEDYYSTWKEHTQRFEELADFLFVSKFEKVPNGNVKLDYIRKWPTGEVGFNTLEWFQLKQNGVMTQADEQDISKKISVVAGFFSVKGNQCPTFKHK